MEYKELSTLYHMDTSSSREANMQRLLDERRTAASSFDIGFSTAAGALFVAVPRELSMLSERVLRRERKISKLMDALPGIAGDAVSRGLVFDEVISSNEIENIHSTRRQLEEALQVRDDASVEKRRFREFARLYLDMVFGEPKIPESIEDIRGIYDLIMDGEASDPPDGKVFRKDSVVVTDGLRALHSGLQTEESIVEAMEAMLRLVNSEEMPSLYGALASHYLFEYAHPFYDGNGRTGRYLLALFLARPLSRPTVLSLSRTMAEHKNVYYQAFKTAEDPLNRGELTFFVMTMLDLIFRSQDELMERLDRNIKRYAAMHDQWERLGARGNLGKKELDLVFVLAQQRAFGMFPDVALDVLAGYMHLGRQQTRKYLGTLEERGLVEKVRGRDPVTFALTQRFYEDAFGEKGQ